ncbi:MAG: DUF4153 domain-containing protein [bacterium]|nr:DUF4153 domain-containing protein [bacterium]
MRFPFVLLDTVVGTVCALILIDNQDTPGSTVLNQVVFGAILGFPLLICLTFTSEKWKWRRSASLGVQLAAILFVGLYSTTVPQNLDGIPGIHPIRLLMLTIGAILLGFSVPFFKRYNELGYWQFCKALCLRVFTTVFSAAVLFGGLAIALAALDYLFGVDIPGRRYGELFVLINGTFAIWFFLAGIPKDLDSLNDVTDYPKELKVFSQFILIPLVIIYFVILYGYLGKILLVWDWPKGWVSRLILGFVATGLVSLLLVHPIRDRIENRWMKTVARWFYVAVIPLTIMLFLAVWQRISDYGITEGRYLGIATVIWLCVIAPYFIFSKLKRILFLPASLCVVVLAVSFGPWGMFSVSERSQVSRLKQLLVQNHLLVDGQVQSQQDSLPLETNRQISSILGYLSDVHGFEAIQPWFRESLLRDSIKNSDIYKDPAQVAKLMSVTYSRVSEASDDGSITFASDRDSALHIDGYERMLRRQRIHSGNTNRELSNEGIAYQVGLDLSTISVMVENKTKSIDTLQVELKPLVDKLITEYGKASADKIPPEKMVIVATSASTMIKIFISSINVQPHDGKFEVMSFEADFAYKY